MKQNNLKTLLILLLACVANICYANPFQVQLYGYNSNGSYNPGGPLIDCFGQTAILQASSQNGVTPISYTLIGNGNSVTLSPLDSTFYNIEAGVYTVIATDANGQTATNTFLLWQPAPIWSQISTNYPLNCNDESFNINTQGGIPPYYYTINSYPNNNGTVNPTAGMSTTATIPKPLIPGDIYTVTVTDMNACTATTIYQPITTNPPTNPFPGIAVNASSNTSSDGAISGLLNSPDPLNYTTISPSGTVTATLNSTTNTKEFLNLTSGTYTIQATSAQNDALGLFCPSTFTQTIGSNVTSPSLTATSTQTNVTCNGDADGGAIVIASGGVAPYLYSLDGAPASANNNFTSLTAGTYIVTVSDNSATPISTTIIITISNPSPIVVTPTINHLLCAGLTNGSASVTVTGGTMPISSYLWSGPAVSSTATHTDASSGMYDVFVVDANGCIGSTSLVITEPAALVATAAMVNNISCNGLSDGSADAVATGGTMPYSFSWSNGNPSSLANGLATGSYTCVVTDGNNCTTTVDINVSEPALLIPYITNTGTLNCQNSATATLTANASGGLSPYAYNWSGAVTSSSATLNNVGVGTYTLVVSDANMCIGTTLITLTSASNFSITNATAVKACNGSFGTITVTANSPATCVSTPFASQSSAGIYINALPNTYTVTATNHLGCTTSTIVTLNNTPPIIFSAGATMSPSCNGSATGTISRPATGGLPGLTYALLTSTTAVQTVPGTFTNLGGGIYTVRATDARGCTKTTAVLLPQPSLVNVGPVARLNPKCFGGSNGTITAASTSGGTGVKTLTLSPTGLPILNGFINLSAGIYTLTVKDANNCSRTSIVSLTQPSPIVIGNVVKINPNVSSGSNNGKIILSATGGTGAKTYSITPVAGIQSPVGSFNNLSAGNYTATVRDANLCTVTTAVTLTLSPLIVNNGTVTPIEANDVMVQNSNDELRNEDLPVLSNPVSEVKIYPNPTLGPTTIELNAEKEMHIRMLVLNQFGAIVKKIEYDVHSGVNLIQVNLSNLTNGQYFIKVELSPEKVITKSVIKQ
jgi:large repetitive protein